jgi:hypothetical protein
MGTAAGAGTRDRSPAGQRFHAQDARVGVYFVGTGTPRGPTVHLVHLVHVVSIGPREDRSHQGVRFVEILDEVDQLVFDSQLDAENAGARYGLVEDRGPAAALEGIVETMSLFDPTGRTVASPKTIFWRYTGLLDA